ncbi:hypothetical protein GQ473_02405 [archaeon]|nr:hypothetical protein [archaeon]
MITTVNENLTNENAFIRASMAYFETHNIPYVISDSNGMFGIMGENSYHSPKESLMGALQSVAIISEKTIKNNLSNERDMTVAKHCMPIVSHIGHDSYAVTAPITKYNISYIDNFQLTTNDIN